MAKKKTGNVAQRKVVKTSAIVVASKGGLARAESLSKEKRAAIAKRAAQERWAKVSKLPRETHTGILKLGDGIACSVLDNGKRVFSVMGLMRAFKSGGKSSSTLDDGTPAPEFLSALNLRPFISPDLRDRLKNTIEFRPMGSGGIGRGYSADILALICEALIDAEKADVLRANQKRLAHGAEALSRALIRYGIEKLIDEATGYHADAASEELQRLVQKYVVEDMRPWVSLFPNSFFKQVYRIHGWPYKEGNTQGPRYVGKFINDYVYARLPDGVLEKLRALNPVVGKHRKHKHHQFLSESLGEPTVDRHLASVTTLMSVSTSKLHFDEMFKIAFPKTGDQLLLPGAMPAPMLPGEVDVASTPELEHVNGIPVIATSASPVEKVLYVLRTNGPTSVEDLALAAYGNNGRGPSREAKNAAQNIKNVLQRMRKNGLATTDGLRIWRVADARE